MTLHTKYRPQALKEVIGHPSIIRSLTNILDKKTSRTFLLTGPTGVGKTTIARAAAKYIHCSGNLNLLELDAATYTGIDDIRNITSSLIYKPIDGSVKVIILDEAHALSSASFKALLKSLEEPPPWVYWFLCTTEPGKIPANIKTRCTSFNLKPIDIDIINDLLQIIATRENLDNITDDIIKLCAKEAKGSPRQAIVNLEACSSAKSLKEAAKLLESVTEAPKAIDLARALIRGAGWREIQGLLDQLKETNAESTRHVIREYMTKVVLGATTDKAAGAAMEILDQFSQPFPSQDGLTPLIMACGHIILASS